MFENLNYCLGVGIITLFGSYRKKNEDITSSSYWYILLKINEKTN